jgi:hypothetical protein
MSDYAVLAAVSSALREILWEAIHADSVVDPLIASESAIVFTNPTGTARDSANRLSVWLYHVSENEFVKNQPLRPLDGDLEYPPLALNLSYLLTPFGTSGEADHLILGKSMQVLFDNAVVLLSDPTNNIHEELHIVLARLPLNELSHVWEALREPYRLSVAYEIRVTRVDSTRRLTAARVIDRITPYESLPTPVGAAT